MKLWSYASIIFFLFIHIAFADNEYFISAGGHHTAIKDIHRNIVIYGTIPRPGPRPKPIRTAVSFATKDGAPTLISAGFSHVVILTNEGYVWTMGRGFYGQLGRGNTKNSPNIEKIETVSQIIEISAGEHHTVLLDSEGFVFTCGLGGSGQLGHGNKDNQSIPLRIANISNIASVSAGSFHTALLDRNGDVWIVGFEKFHLEKVEGVPKIAKISAGGFHTMMLDEQGRVWTIGKGESGQLGHGTSANQVNAKMIENNLPRIVEISAGAGHSVLLDENGEVYTFGQSTSGQLGHGDYILQYRPLKIAGITGVIHISAGSHHTILLNKNNQILSFGNNIDGQLAIGAFIARCSSEISLNDEITFFPTLVKSARNVGEIVQTN